MKARAPLPTLLLVAAISLACSERTQPAPIVDLDDQAQQYAAAFCAVDLQCDCQSEFESTEECETEVVAQFNELAQLADFDQECFDEFMAASFWGTCVGGSMIADLTPQCATFVGRGEVGDVCEKYGPLLLLNPDGTCGASTSCHPVTSTCAVPGWYPKLKQVGDACDELTNSCYRSELFCQDGICQLASTAGESCFEPSQCWALSYCAGLSEGPEGVCTALIEVGESCDPDGPLSCLPVPDDAARCNPTTGVCEVPAPYLCFLFP